MTLAVRKSWQRAFIASLLLVAVLLPMFRPAPASAAAGVNQELNFQGRLLNTQGATVADGNYNIEFKIYQDGDGQSVNDATGSPAGTLKWTEDHLNNASQGVTVKNGYFSVQLGSVTAFGSNINWDQDTLWLSLNIGNTNATCTPFASCSPDGEMTPMKRLSANPYALNAGELGGLTSSQFVQLAQGLQTDASTNTNSIYINKTSTGNLIDLQASGNDAFIITNSGDITFGSNADHTITVAASGSGTAGHNLTISAGNAGSTGAATAGGTLTLQGGSAAGASGNANGGTVIIAGGNGTGAGVSGLVNLGVAAFTSVTNTTCSSNCALSQSNIDNYSTVIVNSSTPGIVLTLPAPTITTTNGRIIYITAANGSSDFTLTANSGGSAISIAMRQNATATMVWNGTDWTAAGASNATTLQATYNNGTNPSTTPEIKLDSTHGTIDIQDADTSIGQDLFDVRASNASNLGTVLLGVGNTGTVTIRNNSDQQAAFRFQNAAGRYVLNVNTASNYFINNGVKALNNELSNPGFEAGTEAGGDTTFGDQGWFGSSLSHTVNDSTNAHSGNYELQVTPNGTQQDIYGGGYYAVQPGDSIYFEGWVKNSAGANGTGGIELTFYDKDEANPTTSTNFGSLPGTTYVLKTINTTVPAGKYYVRVSAVVGSGATAGTYYFDDFLLRRSSIKSPLLLQNSVDSATAFQVQNAAATNTLFAADTTDNLLKVGDSTGTDTNVTVLQLDSASANITTLTRNGVSLNGGLFYNSSTNNIEAVIGGSVADVCTTAVTCTGYSASASSSIQLQASTPGSAQTGNFNITGTGILTQLQTQDTSGSSTNSSNLVVRTGNATGTTSNSGSLTLDTGTATGTPGSITIGHSGVTTTMPGNLIIQGSSTLALGQGSSTTGTIKLYNSVGNNTVTIAAASANPTSSWTLTLPQNPASSAGLCLKDTNGAGTLGFSSCTAGATTTLQDAYNNSSSPAAITLADSKDLQFVAQDTATDPNVLINLQCTTCSANGGRFAVQNAGTDVFTVSPNGGNVIIGSATTNSTETLFQLDSYNGSSDTGTCSITTNQGAIYYNTTMGSIRGCVNGSWIDVSNPDTLGLLTFGIVPSTGSNPYDLPSLVTPGVTGPCKVSWADATHVNIQSCSAYSGGRRVNISTTSNFSLSSANLTTTNIWTHLCLDSNGNLTLTAAASTPTANLTSIYPSSTFSVAKPQLCLADIQGSATTGGNIAEIYDTRTFTSTIKEAINFTTAAELGMMVDSSTAGLVPSASCSSGTCSGKLYGIVVASDGGTSSGTPNGIVATVGSAWVKMTAGTSGQFIHSGPTAGYGVTVLAVPNNAFYYSAGNARTSFSNTCSAASNCSGSVYVNMLVR